MSCASLVHDARDCIESGASREQVLDSLKLVEDELHQVSQECYDQQVLRDVSNSTYKLNPQPVEIGFELTRMCRQAKLVQPVEVCRVEVDTALCSHAIRNGQSNGKWTNHLLLCLLSDCVAQVSSIVIRRILSHSVSLSE